MFYALLKKLTRFQRVHRAKRASRPKAKRLFLEGLESRDLLAALAWSGGASLPIAESGIVAQPVAGKLLVAGGPTSTAYSLTVTDPAWRSTITPAVQPLDFARTSPGAGLLPNGYLAVFGGLQNGFATSSVTQYDPNTLTITDGSTNQSRSLHAMNAPRALLGWTTDASTSQSYALGGIDNNGTPLASVEAYNPSANTWSYVASLPQTLYAESAVSDGAGHLFTFGGVDSTGAITNIVYRYAGATNTWDQVAPLQVGVRDSAALLGPNGRIYVLGGVTATGATPTVESYNSATNTWTIETSLPQAVSSEGVVVDSLGRIEVLGGSDANGNATAAIFVSQKLTQPDLVPTITTSPLKSVVVNSTYSYQVLSTGNPQPSYALSAAPTGMTIDQYAGLVSWTPDYSNEGIANVTVVASSSLGQVSQSFTIGVAPQIPTVLTGAGVAKNAISLSWNASADPNVTGYNVDKRTFLHNPKGSGGTYIYSRVASNVGSNNVTISGSSVAGTYLVSAVNSAGLSSARSAPTSVGTLAPPVLFTGMTLSGADISSQTLKVGETGQIYLVQEFANPAPTFSLVSGPSGISVDSASGLVTYTPIAADIGSQPAVFAATNSVGTSTYTFIYDVLALSPTITLDAIELGYDGTVHPATAAALAVDGMTSVAGSFAYNYNGTSTPPVAAGTYAVTATFTSADPAYADAVATSSLTIDPATPMITANSGPFDFDNSLHAATATAVGVDGLTLVDGQFQFTYDGDSTPPSGPGLFSVAASFVSNDPNYASAIVTRNLIINSPGALVPTLSLVDGSRVYDGTPHADLAEALGVDGVSHVAGGFLITYNGSTNLPTDAGAYDVVATFISADLAYANATVTGNLTIDAAMPAIQFGESPVTFSGAGQQVPLTAAGSLDLRARVGSGGSKC